MRRGLGEPLLVFVVVLVVYLAVTPHTNTAYRHFVYMAMAFLDGRTDLRDLPPHYHDIIRIGDRIYAPFPPVPAVLLLPVVALHGERTDQGRVGQALAAAAVAIFVAGLRRLGFGPSVRWFAGAALAFGSVLWPAAAIGTTWFFAQEVVVLCTALLVWELAGGARPLALGGLVVAAWLTRLSMLPAVPVFAVLVWRRHQRTGAVLAFLAVNAVGILIYLAYNYLRFGDPFQSGYPLLSMGTPNAAAAARWGFFNLRFVPEHLYAMFFRAPELIDRPPFLKPSPWGMSVFFTSPVILRLLFPQGDRRAWLPWAVLVASLAIPMLPYFSVGWVQFGYRYSLDWWVFLLVILAFALGRGPRAIDLALLAASIGANALGAYWVRELGW